MGDTEEHMLRGGLNLAKAASRRIAKILVSILLKKSRQQQNQHKQLARQDERSVLVSCNSATVRFWPS
jgi:hypothetical protein